MSGKVECCRHGIPIAPHVKCPKCEREKSFDGCPLFKTQDTFEIDSVDDAIEALQGYIRGVVYDCPLRKADYKHWTERVGSDAKRSLDSVMKAYESVKKENKALRDALRGKMWADPNQECVCISTEEYHDCQLERIQNILKEYSEED